MAEVTEWSCRQVRARRHCPSETPYLTLAVGPPNPIAGRALRRSHPAAEIIALKDAEQRFTHTTLTSQENVRTTHSKTIYAP